MNPYLLKNLAILDTSDDIIEGSSKLFYTTARFNTDFATKTTDDLTEGSTNLYYDDVLVSANSDVTANTTHRSSDGKDHSDVVLNNAHRVVATGNPHSVTATEVGLGNVDNTSDVNKPVSTAQAAYSDQQAIVFAIALG